MKFAILVEKFETKDMKYFDRISGKVRQAIESALKKSGSVKDCILRVFEHNNELYFRFGDEETEFGDEETESLSKEKSRRSKTESAQKTNTKNSLRKENKGKKRKSAA